MKRDANPLQRSQEETRREENRNRKQPDLEPDQAEVKYEDGFDDVEAEGTVGEDFVKNWEKSDRSEMKKVTLQVFN